MLKFSRAYYIGDTLEELFNNINLDNYRWGDTLSKGIEKYKYLLEIAKVRRCLGCIAVESTKYPIYPNNYNEEYFLATLKPKPVQY